jgi:hypothetical protein
MVPDTLKLINKEEKVEVNYNKSSNTSSVANLRFNNQEVDQLKLQNKKFEELLQKNKFEFEEKMRKIIEEAEGWKAKCIALENQIQTEKESYEKQLNILN